MDESVNMISVQAEMSAYNPVERNDTQDGLASEQANSKPVATRKTAGAQKWAVVCKDNWIPYRAYLLSDLRTSHPFKRSQPPQAGLRRCYGDSFRPSVTALLGVR
ncbi:hypothetical protein AVEN_216683-1 [Araneus ventricosus]|uniref:Uncharacterized protein n=1 Tax=Araneus ventricosus TaxID=182803 RepID=A0A4Y2DU48_ARAVE|nr:hypothetical protein AVEN_216683-1 [Araneus ventricosus]